MTDSEMCQFAQRQIAESQRRIEEVKVYASDRKRPERDRAEWRDIIKYWRTNARYWREVLKFFGATP